MILDDFICLRFQLWGICDARKEDAEAEKSAIVNDAWLDDHMGLLCNHYITLMQSEVDRFVFRHLFEFIVPSQKYEIHRSNQGS